DLLEESLRLVIDRHEALRTSFRAEGGKAVQVVQSRCPWILPAADLDRLLPADREREAQRLALCEANRGFDLGRAPLLRVHALRHGSAATLLLFNVHHIVTDGWSMNILIREVSVLYHALAAGCPSELAELPIQYADFAVWQRERCAGAAGAADLAFWRRYLEDAPRSLELPTDRPRPPGEEGLQG